MATSHSEIFRVNLNGVLGSEAGRVRLGECCWLDDIVSEFDEILSVEIPIRFESADSANRTLVFKSNHRPKVSGMAVGSTVREFLGQGSMLEGGVDALSRSVFLADIDESAFPELSGSGDLTGLLWPALLDEIPDEKRKEAVSLLRSNISTHERQHVSTLLNPKTALRREQELYWRIVILSASREAKRDPAFIDRFGEVYTTPSRFIHELLAMLREDFSHNDNDLEKRVRSTVQEARGVEGHLQRFVAEHGIDPVELTSLLQTRIGQEYCDAWVGYIVDRIREGGTLESVDPAGFRQIMGVRQDGPQADDTPRIREALQHLQRLVYGPVFELVRLRSRPAQGDSEGVSFMIERKWFSMNADATVSGHRLAIRRALFRRVFASIFGTESGLDVVQAQRERAVERIVRGKPFDREFPVNASLKPPGEIGRDLRTAYIKTAETLFGEGIGDGFLELWLNDPDAREPSTGSGE